MINLHAFPQNEVFVKAGERLIEQIKQALSDGKNPLLLLSGGSVMALYPKLAEFIQLKIAQVDERFQPENKEDINARAIDKTGFQVPYYKVRQEGSVKKAAEEYNRTVRDLWKKCDYKIAVLGIGEDCHTAGLIPGYEKDWNIDQYVSGYNLKQGKFRQRITVTPKLLRQLDYALIVAVGEKKKTAIQNALKKENLEDLDKYPAAIIQKIKEVDLFRVDLGL